MRRRKKQEFDEIASKIAVELNADPADQEVQCLAVFEQVTRRQPTPAGTAPTVTPDSSGVPSPAALKLAASLRKATAEYRGRQRTAVRAPSAQSLHLAEGNGSSFVTLYPRGRVEET